MNVGWIGMGRIGKQMALRVLGAGHQLTGHARSPEKASEIVAAGGKVTTSLVEAVTGAALICVNVYSEDQLREALVDGGALAAIAPGAILVIHSTVGPAMIRELVAARPDVPILDAAFSGNAAAATAGNIALMIGGAADAIATARPVLESYADYLAHLGPNGSGMTLKLVNNTMFGAHMIIARDAVKIIVDGGMDKDLAVETLARSSGGSFALGLFGNGADPEQRMTSTWPYMEKDVAVAITAAGQAGFDLGMIETAARPFLEKK